MIGISSDQAFRRLAEALGSSEWVDDPRFKTNPDRVRNTPQLDARISEVLERRPVSHWIEVLDRHDVACDPVETVDQVMADPQLAALGQLEPIELEGQGSALLARLPLDFSLTPAAIQGPPPAVGEHTWAVLREAGYGDIEIEDLLRGGICTGETECKC